MIDFDVAVNKTVELLLRLKLHDKNEATWGNPRDAESIWANVVLECVGKFDFYEALALHTNWKRNVKGFATTVRFLIRKSYSESESRFYFISFF